MQASSPPLILLFGPFDPTGSGHLPADAITCATLGCHPLAVMTALHVQDTANIETIQPVSPELIDDQARLLLEDMSVQAIRIGPLYTTESISALAQIAADYTDVPMVLHLGTVPDNGTLEDADPEDVFAALLELLLPQADIVMAEHGLLAQWRAQGMLTGTDDVARTLLDHGPAWVLSSATPLRPGQSAYVLHGPDGQTMHWPWTPQAQRVHHPDGPLSCALAAQLARGEAMPQAVSNALGQAAALSARTFRPGMGQLLLRRDLP